MTPDEAADALGLGRPLTAPEPLPGGSAAERWRVRTPRGHWMVKTHPVPNRRQREQMRDAGELELAAYTAGVAMPRPVVPPSTPVGLWVNGRVRAAEWVEAGPLPACTVEVATWLGRTLATIDRLGLPADPASGVGYDLHPVADWHRWLADADLLDRRERADLTAALTEATALVEAGLATRPAFQIGHRDANPRNILVGAHGPVLIDFDAAGPEVPWWGAVYHAWDYGRPDITRLGPTVLAAYVEHGGPVGPASPIAFAGAVRGVLDGFAFHLRRASTGHAESGRWARRYAHGVPEMMGSIDGWVELLR